MAALWCLPEVADFQPLTHARCKFGMGCHFAHGEVELRSRQLDSYAPPAPPQQPTHHAAVDGPGPGPMLQGPMQHTAFTGQRLPSLVGQYLVEPPSAMMPASSAMMFAGEYAGQGQRHDAGKGKEKTQLCSNFSAGGCRFGERCSFAHGAAELRGR